VGAILNPATKTMVEIELRQIQKSYGRKEVLRQVDLSFEKGKFSVVFGSPVSGKSVLMRLIMGLEAPNAGQVLRQGKDVTRETAGVRNFGYVPQSFALYPHFQVFDNIAYPLALAGKSKEYIRERVEPLAKKLRIEPLLRKYPSQLSGGEKQRVALARGIVKDTGIFILDDPLVGLDFKLREQLFVDLRVMLSEIDGTFIYTTSDPLETLALADEIFVLDQGRVIDQGTVDRVYDHPAQLRSLQLIGYPSANVVSGKVSGDLCTSILGEFELDFDPDKVGFQQEAVQIGFRPEAVLFGEPHSGLQMEGHELLREDLGAETILYFEVEGVRLIGFWSNGSKSPEIGERFKVGIDPASLMIFDGQSGRRLGCGKEAK
jgi:ABC-type sugar transport system ATPase subunit